MPLKTSKYGRNVSEKDYLDFDAATPMLDGYQGHVWYFGAVEFAIQFGLAFCEFLAQVVPSDKSSRSFLHEFKTKHPISIIANRRIFLDFILFCGFILLEFYYCELIKQSKIILSKVLVLLLICKCDLLCKTRNS